MKVGLMLIIILITALTLCTACNTSNNSDSAHLATVEVIPHTVNLQAGESITVCVNIYGVRDLYGVELNLSYDKAGLEIIDADAAREGIQIAKGTFLTSAQEAENSALGGQIEYAAELAMPAAPLNGDGNLVEITCRALQAGTYTLDIHTILLTDPQGAPIPFHVLSPESTPCANDLHKSTKTPRMP